MHTRSRGLLAAFALVLSASLTACGGGDDEKASQAIADQLSSEQVEGIQATDEQATCVGDGFVDELGVDKLKEYGILNDDLEVDEGLETTDMSEEDAGKAADVLMDCVDFREMMGDTGEMPDEVRDCLDDALSDDAIHALLTGLFSGDTSGQEEYQQAILECASAGAE